MDHYVSKPTTAGMQLPARGRESSDTTIPAYMQEVYRWAYLDSRNARMLDHEWVVNLILWGNSPVLRRALLSEIEPACQVFQAAHVYGRMLPDLARKIGPEGCLEVVDVVPLQADLCRRKLCGFSNAQVRIADAAHHDNRRYDTVVCYFLLHELPEPYKHAVVESLLYRMAKHGKVVFIDYHRPVRWHPLGRLMRLVFKTLEPFATSLTHNEISSYASHGDAFDWRKQTFFGGLYQKVVASRR